MKPGSMPTSGEATGADPGKGSCWPGLGACGSVSGQDKQCRLTGNSCRVALPFLLVARAPSAVPVELQPLQCRHLSSRFNAWNVQGGSQSKALCSLAPFHWGLRILSLWGTVCDFCTSFTQNPAVGGDKKGDAGLFQAQ